MERKESQTNERLDGVGGWVVLKPEHTMRTKCAISDAFVPYCVIA